MGRRSPLCHSAQLCLLYVRLPNLPQIPKMEAIRSVFGKFYHFLYFTKSVPVLQDGEAPAILTRDVSISFDCESLPSYTIASGLPSYEEAIKQIENFKKLKEKECPQLVNSPSRVSLIACIHSIVNEKS